MRVFYLSHSDPTEISQIINTVMRIPTAAQPAIFPNKTANTITVRGTATMVEVIDRLIRANDKPRAEVVIDVQILEVNRNRTKEFGLNLSNYALGLTFSPEVAPPNTPGADPADGAAAVQPEHDQPGHQHRGLLPDGADRGGPLPRERHAHEADCQAAAARRGGQEMTLNLGEEIPVISTVFGAAVSGGFASIPQSSFNYRPVGVNIAMTPRVTYEGEVILDLTVESSTLGAVDQRRRARTCRRSDRGRSRRGCGCAKGSRTCSPACSRTTSAKSLTGFPGVLRVPVLRSLFGSTADTINQTDIVMLLTPHIVRTHELTAEDLAPIYIGTQQNVGLTRSAAADRAGARTRNRVACASRAPRRPADSTVRRRPDPHDRRWQRRPACRRPTRPCRRVRPRSRISRRRHRRRSSILRPRCRQAARGHAAAGDRAAGHGSGTTVAPSPVDPNRRWRRRLAHRAT